MADEIKEVGSLQELENLENKIEESVAEGNADDNLKGTPDEPKEEVVKVEETPKVEEEKKEVKEPIEEPTELVVDDVVKLAEAEGIEKLSAEQKKLLIDEGYDLGDESDTPVATELQETIESATGIKLDIDLGDTPMDTPEGMTKYLNAYADNQVAAFERTLAENFPEAYKAFQIEIDGGSAAEYFSSVSTGEMADYSKAEFNSDDSQQHKQIMYDALTLKGVDEEDIIDFIKLAEDTNQLESKAKKEFGGLKQHQEENKRAYESRVAQQRQADESQMQQMSGYLQKVVDSGKLDNFNIPSSDKKKFMNHLQENIYFDKGEFFITKKVDNNTINDMLKQEFFNYRNGDIADLINKGAKKKLALNLKKKIGQADKGLDGKGGVEKGYKSLSEL